MATNQEDEKIQRKKTFSEVRRVSRYENKLAAYEGQWK